MKCITTVAVALSMLLSSSAWAGITSTTGAVVVSPAPSDLREGATESNTAILAIHELQDVLLSQSLPLNITIPGTSPFGGSANLSPGSLPAGSRVSSYLIHFDSLTNNSVAASGSITFDSAILGIVALSDTLHATNGLVGLPGVMYPQGDLRGFELVQQPGGSGGGLDSLTLSADRRTVSFDLQNVEAVDQMRLITAIVPEPSTLALFAVGTGMLLRMRRRR